MRPDGPRAARRPVALGCCHASDEAEQARVFRIENLAVQELLGVPRRKGLLYSLAEIAPKMAELQRAAMSAANLKDKDPSQVTTDQHKMMEMANRARAYLRLRQAFEPTQFPPLPTPEFQQSNPQEAEEQLQTVVQAAMEAMQRARSAREAGMPLIVPGRDELDWLPFGSAVDRAFVSRWMQDTEPDTRLVAWTRMLGAYAREDAREFNRAVMGYQRMLDKDTPASVQLSTVRFEHFFNHARPLSWCMAGYVFAFFIGCLLLGGLVSHPESCLLLVDCSDIRLAHGGVDRSHDYFQSAARDRSALLRDLYRLGHSSASVS